jgi:imidazolonepropionase
MLKVFKNIHECLTLKGASLKEGRNITEEDLSIIPNAAIVTKKNKIAWIGPSKKIPKEFKKAKSIDLKG